MSKSSGFRVDHSWKAAATTALVPSHNEFWNCITDVLPLCFFFATGLALPAMGGYDRAPVWFREAVLHTTGATCVQHVCSLVAHTFACVSARMSHTIWFVDYAGIAINFVANAPAMALILYPDLLATYWPAWRRINMVTCSVVLLLGALLAWRLNPATTESGPGVSWASTFFQSGVTSGIALVSLFGPNLAFTALVGVFHDPLAGAVVVGLPIAVAIKETHMPELLLKSGVLDHSMFHSHAVWHGCVWVLQLLYLRVFVNHMATFGESTGDGLLDGMGNCSTEGLADGALAFPIPGMSP